MDVSENNGTTKIIHFNRVFRYKPSILGYPHFWKHPYQAHISLFCPWSMKFWRSWYGDYRPVPAQEYIHPLSLKIWFTISFCNFQVTLLEWSRAKTCCGQLLCCMKRKRVMCSNETKPSKNALSADLGWNFLKTPAFEYKIDTNHFANAHVTSPRDQLRCEQVINCF